MSQAAAPPERALRVLAPLEGQLQSVAPPEWVFRVLAPLEGQLHVAVGVKWLGSQVNPPLRIKSILVPSSCSNRSEILEKVSLYPALTARRTLMRRR